MVKSILPKNMNVAEVRRHPGAEPHTLAAQTPLEDLRRQLAGDPWRGRMYVLDRDRRVVGTIDPERLAAWLFPLEAAMAGRDEVVPLRLERIGANCVADVMNSPPTCMHDSTPVQDVVAVMISEHAVEAPVVDDAGRLIGQVDLAQVLSACMETNMP